MSEQPNDVPDVVVRVRRDLRAIEKLCTESVTGAGYVSQLRTQAVAAGDDPDMPGGNAMVALAHVADPEAWENALETAEELAEARSWLTGEPVTMPEHEDGVGWEPPLQTLVSWSHRWRQQLGHELDVESDRGTYVARRPSVTSEAAFLRWAVEWAVDNEPWFDRFVAEIARARTRTENLLHDGVRSERGVPCLYDECGGIRLVRKLIPGRDGDGNKMWFHSKWHCPRCHREWDEDEYARMKTAAAEAAKIEQIPVYVSEPGDPEALEEQPGDTWVSVEYAAHRTGRPPSTIRVWAHRGRVATVCLLAGRRRNYIRVADLDEQHALAERRAEAVRAGKRRRRSTTHVR